MLSVFRVLLCALLLMVFPGIVGAQGGGEPPAQVQAKLDSFVRVYLQNCNAQLRPGKATPQVTNRDGKVVATYMELDLNTAKTELYPGNNSNFAYLAKLSYVEHTYEAVGNTPEEALNGVYMRIKSRRLTELPRYVQGAWQN